MAPGRDNRGGRLSAWLLVIGIALLVALPTALLFGVGDLIFGPRSSTLVTVIGTVLGLGALLLVKWGVEYWWEQRRERDRARKSDVRTGH